MSKASNQPNIFAGLFTALGTLVVMAIGTLMFAAAPDTPMSHEEIVTSYTYQEGYSQANSEIVTILVSQAPPSFMIAAITALRGSRQKDFRWRPGHWIDGWRDACDDAIKAIAVLEEKEEVH